MNPEDQIKMYKKAAADDFRGSFEFFDPLDGWKICNGILPENRPGRTYRYLPITSKISEPKTKSYDKDSFLRCISGRSTLWVRLERCTDMVVVTAIGDAGINIGARGSFLSWESLQKEGWQWTQFDRVVDYNGLSWQPFEQET